MYGYGDRQFDMPRGDVVTTFAGVDIHYNKDSEKFEAKLGHKIIRRATIGALRKEIGMRTERKVELMTSTGAKVVVVGKTPEDRWRREDGELYNRHYSLYQWDADLSRKLKQLYQADAEWRDAIHKRNEELRALLVRVDDMPPAPEPEPEKPVETVGRAVMARRRSR